MLSAMSGIQLISSSTPLIQGYSVAASIRADSLTVISGYESDSPMVEGETQFPCSSVRARGMTSYNNYIYKSFTKK